MIQENRRSGAVTFNGEPSTWISNTLMSPPVRSCRRGRGVCKLGFTFTRQNAYCLLSPQFTLLLDSSWLDENLQNALRDPSAFRSRNIIKPTTTSPASDMAPERPSPYRSRYLLYKKGSQQVVTWLYETASALDTHSKSLDQLCVDDLPSLAQTISNAKIELPKSIASTLSDVIYLRQQAHEWYSSLARDNAAADDDRIGDINKSHRYFIEKLKGVRATLDPTGAKAAKHDSSQQQQETPPSDISNIFASLELEEPTDAPLGDEAESDAFDQAADVFAGKLEDTRRFKIWCMLKDVQDIRAHVRLLWRR